MTYEEIYKEYQGGSQLRDKARSMRLHKSKRQSIVYNCSPMLRLRKYKLRLILLLAKYCI